MCQPLLCDPIPMIWEDHSTASPSHLRQSFAIHWRLPPTFIHIISPSIKKKKSNFYWPYFLSQLALHFTATDTLIPLFPFFLHLFITFIQVKDLYNHCTIIQTSPSSHTHPDFCSWGPNWNCSELIRVPAAPPWFTPPHVASLTALYSWTLCVLCLPGPHTLFSSYLTVSSFLVPGLSLWSSSLLYTHSLGTLTDEIGSKFWSSADSCIQLPVGWDQVSDGLTPLPP